MTSITGGNGHRTMFQKINCDVMPSSHNILRGTNEETALTFVLGAQKNHVVEMVHLSTHNICFG